MEYETHPAAEIFPLMSDTEFTGLVEDIREHGLKEAIVLCKGEILDGRNRYRACLEIGIEPRLTEWISNGQSPESYVVSKNLHRRHLKERQRAMVAGKLSNLYKGLRVDRSKDPSTTIDNAASLLNISTASVKRARAILRDGTPEEIAAVEAGEAAVVPTAKRVLARSKTSEPKKKQTVHKGPILNIPDGMTAEEVCRQGLDLERTKNISAESIGKHLSINHASYRMMRDIVLLSDMDSLSQRDAETVATALAEMNATKQARNPHTSVVDIANRVWGQKRARTDTTIAKRLEEFEHAFGHIIFTCSQADAFEIPNLSAERINTALTELKGARRHLDNLKLNLEKLL